MVHELEVWLFTDRVGTLALIDGRLSFRYVPDWLSRPDALALSASQPLQAASFDDARSTGVYPTLTPKMAMKIGTKYKSPKSWCGTGSSLPKLRASPRPRPNDAFSLWQGHCRPLRPDDSAAHRPHCRK